MKKLNKKGFTIVELVIVIAVIAILAGVLIPTFATVVEKANQSKAMQEAKNEYEAYLAEYAKDLDGKQNLDVVAGDYYFEVRNGEFNTTAKDAKNYAKESKVDLTKVYTVTTTFNNDSTYTYSKGIYTKLESAEANKTYYSQDNTKDLGSANVYIYAVTTTTTTTTP